MYLILECELNYMPGKSSVDVGRSTVIIKKLLRNVLEMVFVLVYIRALAEGLPLPEGKHFYYRQGNNKPEEEIKNREMSDKLFATEQLNFLGP